MSMITLEQANRIIEAIFARGRELGCAALALGRSSSLVRVRTEERPLFMQYVIRASNDQIFPEGGGMLIRDQDGEVIGAVGVTGDTQERDEELAAHGIRAAGLRTDEDCANMGTKVRLQN